MLKTFGKTYISRELSHFDPDKTFNCGQCFRFEKNGSAWEGVAKGKYVSIKSDGDGTVFFSGADAEEFRTTWRDFLDCDTDYDSIADDFSALGGVMGEAVAISRGIRILRQDPWEALCSFIISQNNNIPRIKKIINALCREYGEKIYSPDGREFYTFPTPRALFEAGEEGIYALKTGFRAKYLYDAAKKIVLRDIDLKAVYDMDTQSGAEYLKQIKGVGDKVSACVLLFAYHKTDSFPIDIWVKKILKKYFDGKVPDFGTYAGIAQQYLFFYERYIVNGKE